MYIDLGSICIEGNSAGTTIVFIVYLVTSLRINKALGHHNDVILHTKSFVSISNEKRHHDGVFAYDGNERIKKILQTQVPLHVAQGIILEREKSQAKVDSSVRSYISGHVLHVHPTQDTPTTAQEQQHQLYLTMKDNPQLQHDDLPIWLALKYKFERLHMAITPCRLSTDRPKDQDDPHDDDHPEGEDSAKRQKTSEHGTFVFGESSSSQDYESEPGPSTSSNQDQSDDFDFWINSYATDDDVLPNEKVSQELVDEMSQTVNEEKLRKVVNEMKEIIVPPYQLKPTPVIQSCQRDPKAPAISLVNQDLLYLKKGNTGTEKIALSLHKFPAVRFPDNNIEERTFRWLDYNNLNKNDIEDMYLLIINHKVGDYAETRLLWSLSVFIKSTVIWERVHDFQLGVESYQQQVNLTAPTITFPGIKKYKLPPAFASSLTAPTTTFPSIKKYKVFSIVSELVVLDGLKSYNNDVKYGYVTHNFSKEDVEYLQLFAEEIEERLKYHDQMRRWEMYVNGRPLGSRRERPE
ncbi:hypothetical protein Tco_1173334 [Tanacetum coccineum]